MSSAGGEDAASSADPVSSAGGEDVASSAGAVGAGVPSLHTFTISCHVSMKFCDAPRSIDLISFSISDLEISIFRKCLSQSLLQLEPYSLTHRPRYLRYLRHHSRPQSGSSWFFPGSPDPLLSSVLHQSHTVCLFPIYWYLLLRQTPEDWKICIEVSILIQKVDANRLLQLTAATIVTTTTAINTFILDLKYFLFFSNFQISLVLFGLISVRQLMTSVNSAVSFITKNCRQRKNTFA